MKCIRIVFLVIALLLLVCIPITAAADGADISLSLSKNVALVGDSVTASGKTAPNAWVPLKVIDGAQSIVVFDAQKADAGGNYSIGFIVPAGASGTLTVVAGEGANVATASLTVGTPGGGPGGGLPQPTIPSGATLLLTGTGLKEDVLVGTADWNINNPAFVNRYFSSNNNWDFHKIWKVKGLDLLSLFGPGNLKTDQDYTVTFVSADGLKYTETISSLKNRYYYPQFTIASGTRVDPMIGFYRHTPFEPDYQGLPATVTWTDRPLTEADLDGQAPRLYLGQRGSPSDLNQPFFVRELVRIVVGEERPALAAPVIPVAGTEVTLDTGKYMTREVITENGRVIEKLVLDEQIGELMEQLAGRSLVIQAEDACDELQVTVPGSALKVASSNDITLVVQTEAGRYYLPVAILPLEAMARELGVDVAALSVTVSLSALGEEQAADLAAALEPGQQMLSTPLSFTLTFTANGKTKTLTSFGGAYVKREIRVDGAFDADAATGVSWNDADKGFRFVPTGFVTRDDQTFAVLLSPHNSIYTVLQTGKTFTDLGGHWAADDINMMAAKLLVSGRSVKLFDPASDITRAETAVLLTRGLALLDGKPDALNFADVTGKEWFAGALAAAVEEKLVAGYPDGNLYPGRSISRQEMAVLLARALRNITVSQTELPDNEVEAQLSRFSDSGSISDWARGDVALAVKEGIVRGYPDGSFAPHARVDRAQGTVMLLRFLQGIGFLD